MKTDLTTRKASLWTPELQAVVPAIQTGLEANYASVAVEVVACPDLTTLGCAAAGISGSTCLVDVGGEPYAHNPKYRDIELDTAKIAVLCDHPEAAILGAGMAHRRMLDGHVGEWIPTLQLNGANRSKVARVGADKACVVEDYPSTLHSGLSNLFLSEGKRVPVIMIRVARRIGDQASFPQAIRQSLIDHLPVRNEQQLGVGGVFVVDAGRIRSHVSPDYECITHHYYDTKSERVVADFLQFYEHMGPDLVCLSVFWTGDPTGTYLHLRPSGEHTHFFHRGDLPQAGHYHYDVTPGEIAYSGYFSLAAEVYRVNDIYQEIENRRLVSHDETTS